MKYRHLYHAGNFADVHKHVTLLTVLAALKRKEKGFLYFETHAGRGVYDLADSAAESRHGIGRLVGAECVAAPLRRYLVLLEQLRAARGGARLYPGSPWLAASELRAQDRAVFIESVPEEARALERALSAVGTARIRAEVGDGFEKLRSALPPSQGRALTLIDPPYEDTRRDFERTSAAVADAIKRFPTGVVAVWYPVKMARDTERWLDGMARRITRAVLTAELRLYPADSRVALNGSGMLIINPPYQLDAQLSELLAELYARLAVGPGGGVTVQPRAAR
jgi:23S rRNA (adenine2030-N6)-methyltransferase